MEPNYEDFNEEEGNPEEDVFQEEAQSFIEEEELDDEDLLPDHDLYKPLQESLKKQLLQQYEAIEIEIRDKIAQKSKLTEDREQIGVELYSIQQTLAKLQTSLTEANELRIQYEADRAQTEEELKEVKGVLQQHEGELKERTKEYEFQRDELDRLNDTVLRLEKHNQELLNQVAVTRRETYKSEQSASETEISKQEQDMYIDKLTQQLQSLNSNLSVVEAQILSQRGETKTARNALLQASLEMEKIVFERNHLVQEWNSSIVNVKRRAKTLSDIEEAVKKQNEEIRALQNEYNGIKQQIIDQQEIHERNTSLYTKIKNRNQYLEGKIAESENERQRLQNSLKSLYESISKEEHVLSRLHIDLNQAISEFKLSQKGANEISNQIHELEDSIIQHVSEQTNMKRDAVAAQTMVQKVRDSISAKDRELSNLQNEVTKLQIDKLNITGQCSKFERGLKEIVEELKQKESLISQYEMQIRKNNVNIEKLQSDVDKLNRKYEELTSAQNGEEYGPLERKIRQLESRIVQSDEISQENQAVWLKKQTELVSLTHSCEDAEEENQKVQAHIAVLSRKRDRTRNNLEATEKEIEKFQIQIRLMQREMSRLGEQLSQSSGASHSLVEGNINFEADILEQLRKKEIEAAETESKIEELANNREELAEELLETEKTIMMWEKKLQLAREMKEALDPNYGASELKSMKKEVARMELRLKQIKKQQQTIVQEMEYALRRRETIANRGAVQKRLNQDKTRSDVSKGITEIKREIKKMNEDSAKIEREIQETIDLEHEQSAELEQLNLIMRELSLKKSEVEVSLRNEEKIKLVSQTKLERLQTKARMFKESSGKPVIKKPESYESMYENLKLQENQIQQIIDMLSFEYPHLSYNLNDIKERMFMV